MKTFTLTRTVQAALIAAVMGGTTTAVMANITDYKFELVDQTVQAGPDKIITVRLMSGGQSASVGLMIANQISLLQYPAACANAVVLLVIVLMMIAAILRIVDIRKEL